MIIPNIWIRKHVPNHQPDRYYTIGQERRYMMFGKIDDFSLSAEETTILRESHGPRIGTDNQAGIEASILPS